MSWSYGDSQSALDQVRRLVGDIDTTDQLVTDESINAELAIRGNDILETAKAICMMLAAKFSRKAVQRSAGKYSEDFRALADQFRKQAQMIIDMGADPCEEVAEQTFGDPRRPWEGSQEKDYENRNDLRNT